MLNAIFLMNSVGDVLVLKPLTVTRHLWSPEVFHHEALKKSTRHVLPLCVKVDNVYYTHAKKNDVYVVAVTTTQSSSPYLLIEGLNNFIKQCSDLIGDLTSNNILNHIAVVYDLLLLSFGFSHPDCNTTQALSESKQMAKNDNGGEKLFPFVPTNLFGVSLSKEEKYMKEGSASKVPLSAKQQEKSTEIFVDLIEHLVAIIDCNGQIVHSDLRGELSTKSYLAWPLELQIALSDKIIQGKPDSQNNEGRIVISEKRFHTLANSSEEAQREKDFPVVKHLSNPGFSAVMDYHVANENITLPFTMYHNFSKTEKGSVVELKLTCKLFCALPLGISPINWLATFPLPSKLLSVSGFSSLKSIEFQEDKENRTLLLKSSIFPSQSHHSVTINMILSEISSFSSYEMPHFNIAFEVPNLCLSNIKIQGLKAQSVTSNVTPTIAKWVRCSTHAKDYQFELTSDWA